MNAQSLLISLSALVLAASPLSAASTYTVKSGDTLSAIARRTGTTSSELMSLNGISDPTKLRIGQTLKLKTAAITAPKANRSSAPQSSASSHTVASGDTLYKIAKKTGTSIATLKALNPSMNPNQLSIGQSLKLRGAAPKPAPLAKPKPAPIPEPKKAATPEKKSTPPAPQVLAELTPSTLPPVQETLPTPQMPTTPVDELPSINSLAAATVEDSATPDSNPFAINSVMVKKEISFGTLASQHDTTTSHLNALNGWSLKPTTILARGSEIYIPGS